METNLNNQTEKREAQTCIICYSDDVIELKCKMICNNCGYKRDCSDP